MECSSGENKQGRVIATAAAGSPSPTAPPSSCMLVSKSCAPGQADAALGNGLSFRSGKPTELAESHRGRTAGGVGPAEHACDDVRSMRRFGQEVPGKRVGDWLENYAS